MLRDLYSGGQFGVLTAFRDGHLSIEELLAAKRERRLNDDDFLVDLTLRRPLFDGIEAALAKSAAGEKTLARYRLSAKKLAASGLLPKNAKLRDLANVDWKVARRDWPSPPSDWNALRRMISTVLTITLGGDVFHPYRRRIVKMIPKAQEPKGRTAPITLDIFLAVQAKMPEHARPCVWTLLLTGARTGEYLRLQPAHLNDDLCAVAIPGTKTAGSRSTVFVAESHWPWVVLGVPSPIQYRWPYRHWKAAAKAGGHPSLTLHDIRSLHAIVALERGARPCKTCRRRCGTRRCP